MLLINQYYIFYQEIIIYAGVDLKTGEPTSDAVGTYCEYVETKDPEEFKYFGEYRESLKEGCPQDKQSGMLKWTPDADTPNIVYYQVSNNIS